MVFYRHHTAETLGTLTNVRKALTFLRMSGNHSEDNSLTRALRALRGEKVPWPNVLIPDYFPEDVMEHLVVQSALNAGSKICSIRDSTHNPYVAMALVKELFMALPEEFTFTEKNQQVLNSAEFVLTQTDHTLPLAEVLPLIAYHQQNLASDVKFGGLPRHAVLRCSPEDPELQSWSPWMRFRLADYMMQGEQQVPQYLLDMLGLPESGYIPVTAEFATEVFTGFARNPEASRILRYGAIVDPSKEAVNAVLNGDYFYSREQGFQFLDRCLKVSTDSFTTEDFQRAVVSAFEEDLLAEMSYRIRYYQDSETLRASIGAVQFGDQDSPLSEVLLSVVLNSHLQGEPALRLYKKTIESLQ